MNTRYKIAASSIEYLIVVCLLFTIFITIVDIGLYFRQPYLIQAFADNLLVDIQNSHDCTNANKTAEIIQKRINKNFSKNENVTNSTTNGNLFTFSSENFTIILACKNNKSPSSLLTQYNYNGIFLYKNHRINSNSSVNLSLYY